MSLADAFVNTEQAYREDVRRATFGHLAPEKNKTYKGRIVYAVGCFGDDSLNPTTIFCEFDGLDSSPWFFDALQEFLSERDNVEGHVYEFTGTVRNYKFKGCIKTLLDANKRAKAR